jgi:hypothetical protein
MSAANGKIAVNFEGGIGPDTREPREVIRVASRTEFNGKESSFIVLDADGISHQSIVLRRHH